MKKFISVSAIVFILFFSIGLALAEEKAENSGSDTEKAVPYSEMTDMQIAMMLINNQFEYLMKQITEREARINDLIDDYEKRLTAESDRVSDQVETLRERISQLEEKLASKENELKDSQGSLQKLEKETAIFISESGLYLKILLGFLAGSIFGMLFGSILHWWKRKGSV